MIRLGGIEAARPYERGEVAVRREGDDRDSAQHRVGADQPEQLEAVDLGHVDVGKNEMESLFFEFVQGLVERGRPLAGVAFKAAFGK